MIIEVICAFILLGIAVIFFNPGHLAMPESTVSMLVLGLIISFLIFAAFILKETSSDERETLHIMRASRISYLVGVAILLVGIVVQTFNHAVDPWLVISLAGMLLSKIISRVYSQHKM